MPENTRILLIAQMKRVIELLEGEELKPYSYTFAEVEKKLREIRRDSIRYIQELKPWTRK